MPFSPELLLAEAQQLEPQILADRRTLHQNAEVGPCLPVTKAFVARRLTEMGYAPQEICESGIVATLAGADTGRCILLRADMDALRGREDSGLPFAAQNGCMHACGHDLHAAMLLGAAQLLKNHQAELNGTVKLVFQPDEEGFTGAKAMLAAGALEAPTPQAALALHVMSGMSSGAVICGRGNFMSGCTLFRITITGRGCHGAMPETGIDPINIAAHVYLALQTIKGREIAPQDPLVVTIGSFNAGQLPNVIPRQAVLEGTIRSFDQTITDTVLRRIQEIAQGTAAALRGEAVVETLASALPLKNDPALVDKMAGYAAALFGPQLVHALDQGGMGSEDFAAYSHLLPCAYLLLGAGTPAEDPRFGLPMHNERVVFNEDVLARGAALHTFAALRWLADAE